MAFVVFSRWTARASEDAAVPRAGACRGEASALARRNWSWPPFGACRGPDAAVGAAALIAVCERHGLGGAGDAFRAVAAE